MTDQFAKNIWAIVAVAFLGFGCIFLQHQSLKNYTQRTTYMKLGTAFFINNEGYVATASHVVTGETHFNVIYKGEKYPAKLITYDRNIDMAILKADIKPDNFISISSTYNQQDTSGTYGYPANMKGLVLTFGKYTYSDDILYLNYQSCHGNSGGPVLNSRGENLGMLLRGTGNVGEYCSSTSEANSSVDLIKLARYANVPISITNSGESHTYTYWYNKYKNIIVLIEAYN